jgi:hypothetical protein
VKSIPKIDLRRLPVNDPFTIKVQERGNEEANGHFVIKKIGIAYFRPLPDKIDAGRIAITQESGGEEHPVLKFVRTFDEPLEECSFQKKVQQVGMLYPILGSTCIEEDNFMSFVLLKVENESVRFDQERDLFVFRLEVSNGVNTRRKNGHNKEIIDPDCIVFARNLENLPFEYDCDRVGFIIRGEQNGKKKRKGKRR